MDLRRRARRRLVGAIALALVAVVVLPMVFDPEPKPLGSDVEIRIPDPATPFQPGGHPIAPAAPGPSAGGEDLPPTLSPTPQADATPAVKSEPEPAKPAAEPEKAVRVPPPKVPEKNLPPPSGPFATEGYYLQLGAFSSERNARQLADKAGAAGFKTSVYTANGQSRVRVGPFEDRRDALDMQRKLKAKDFSTVLLGP